MIGQVSISRSRLSLGMTEHSTNHRQACPVGCENAGEVMPEIMNADIVQASTVSDFIPDFGQSFVPIVDFKGREDEIAARQAGLCFNDLKSGFGEGDYLGSGF